MGVDQSVPQSQSFNETSYLGDCYVPVSGQRNISERFPDLHPQTMKQHNQKIIFTMPYSGIWSTFFPESLGPSPRVGQCSVYCQEYDQMVIAYGSTSTGKYFNDAWLFDFHNLRWNLLSNNLLSPRTGCRAALIGEQMYIFGGGHNGKFYADLHVLNIHSGEFHLVQTEGPAPLARTMPVFVSDGHSLFVWGGYNGQNPSELSILDLSTLKWTQINFPISGRPSPSYALSGNSIYIFGSTHLQGLGKITIDQPSFLPIDVVGEEPSISTLNSSMVAVNQYLITFGGTKADKTLFTHVYAFDTLRNAWFIFYVKPDNDSLSVSDGEITNDGYFVLPREHSYSACYRPCQRQIVSVLGSNERDPPPFFVLSVGEALAILNLQEDLIFML